MPVVLPGRATRNFLLVLSVMYVIVFIDRVNLAAAAGVIKDDLGLSNIELGVAFSAFNYAYAPFQLVGGWIADRYGSRLTLAVCALIWAVTTMMTGAVGGLMSLFLVRFMLGMGEGATFPAATRALAKWTSADARGFGIGVTHAAGRIGAGITAPIVAVLITVMSWRLLFVVLGIASAIWAVVWLWFFRDDPREYPGISEEELATLPGADPTIAATSGPVPWRRLIPRVAPLMMTYFCMGWTGWLYVTWMPSLFSKNYDIDMKKSSMFFAVTFLCAMLAEFIGGIISDYLLQRSGSKKAARSLLVTVCLLLALAALIPAIFVHNLAVGVVSFTLALFFLDTAISPMWIATIDIAPDYVGSASALMNAAGAVAGILSPVAFGFILDRTGSWTLPFAVSMALMLLGAITAFWIRPEQQLVADAPPARLVLATE
ncbi:MAG TPA: MFS transporter [Stellaceae bacterium]|jgi:sugar phosphate permease|nr:MFS transporter [Stellaceae bacterium]